METRACWYFDYGVKTWLGGMFHLWGFESPNDNTVISIAIVEDKKTGRVITVPPRYVYFGPIPPTGFP